MTMDGRLLARNGAVNLDTNTITTSACAAGTTAAARPTTPTTPGTPTGTPAGRPAGDRHADRLEEHVHGRRPSRRQEEGRGRTRRSKAQGRAPRRRQAGGSPRRSAPRQQPHRAPPARRPPSPDHAEPGTTAGATRPARPAGTAASPAERTPGGGHAAPRPASRALMIAHAPIVCPPSQPLVALTRPHAVFARAKRSARTRSGVHQWRPITGERTAPPRSSAPARAATAGPGCGSASPAARTATPAGSRSNGTFRTQTTVAPPRRDLPPSRHRVPPRAPGAQLPRRGRANRSTPTPHGHFFVEENVRLGRWTVRRAVRARAQRALERPAGVRRRPRADRPPRPRRRRRRARHVRVARLRAHVRAVDRLARRPDRARRAGDDHRPEEVSRTLRAFGERPC